MTIAPRRRARQLAHVYAGCTVMLALPTALIAPGSPWVLAILAPGALLFGLIAVRHVRELTHLTVLTSSQLLAPAPLRGWQTIDLADVVSVAMHYEGDHEAGVEWELRIATALGRTVRLPVDEHPILLGWASPRFEGEAEAEWRRLRDRAGGGPAAVIASQVIAVQGLDGPFARSASSG